MTLQNEMFPRRVQQKLTQISRPEALGTAGELTSKAVLNFSTDISKTGLSPVTFGSAVSSN
jgi:hypothetical protein